MHLPGGGGLGYGLTGVFKGGTVGYKEILKRNHVLNLDCTIQQLARLRTVVIKVLNVMASLFPLF